MPGCGLWLQRGVLTSFEERMSTKLGAGNGSRNPSVAGSEILARLFNIYSGPEKLGGGARRAT